MVIGFSPLLFLNYISISTQYLNEFVGFATSILILHLVSSDSLLNKLLSSKIPVYIGKISYSLYIFHALVYFLFFKLYSTYHSWPQLIFISKFIVSFVVAILSWNLIEKRIINKGRLYLKNAKT
jgi:peptidoglycan/LPS O-acetylase OafA/YrhL